MRKKPPLKSLRPECYLITLRNPQSSIYITKGSGMHLHMLILITTPLIEQAIIGTEIMSVRLFIYKVVIATRFGS